jgi:hypothetical protein
MPALAVAVATALALSENNALADHPGSIFATKSVAVPSLLPSLLAATGTTVPEMRSTSVAAPALQYYREREAVEERQPDDHTPLFRIRHESAARSKDAKCSYCHAGLSGSTRDACNDCHAVMRPRSHTVRFSSVVHGRLAAVNSTKCAVCHEGDYCTACHQITPESHFPLNTFILKHNRTARANPRSCLTCHSYETTCAKCHASGLAPIQQSAAALRAALRRLP